MTARWPDPDRTIIDHHLTGLGLRSMKSRTCYRQVLHGFQDVAEHHSELGQDVLVAWLRVSAECWAATTLLLLITRGMTCMKCSLYMKLLH